MIADGTMIDEESEKTVKPKGMRPSTSRGRNRSAEFGVPEIIRVPLKPPAESLYELAET